MAQVEFYDVKTRAKVKIDDKNITKVKMDTKSGPRYAIKGKTADGRNLTKFVGAAVGRAALDAAAGHPGAEAVGVVVAAAVGGNASSRGRGAAEFAAPDDEGGI